ncbi:unnamed protein product [Toxocara canis]|uniref:Histone domain-containing protein n=1 Tax=Toxocara canis TaxID=6265 RepID=A0A183UEU3_TOXCA|nr:unnamed protein product [Toxocara canis]
MGTRLKAKLECFEDHSTNRFHKLLAAGEHSGERALREIRYLQRCTNLLIERAVFRRSVVQLVKRFGGRHLRLQSHAITVLQEATEAFIVNLFADCTLACAHARRKVLLPEDMTFVRRLRGEIPRTSTVSHLGSRLQKLGSLKDRMNAKRCERFPY